MMPAVASGIAFYLVGIGSHTTQTAGLALASDLSAEDKIILGTCGHPVTRRAHKVCKACYKASVQPKPPAFEMLNLIRPTRRQD